MGVQKTDHPLTRQEVVDHVVQYFYRERHMPGFVIAKDGDLYAACRNSAVQHWKDCELSVRCALGIFYPDDALEVLDASTSPSGVEAHHDWFWKIFDRIDHQGGTGFLISIQSAHDGAAAAAIRIMKNSPDYEGYYSKETGKPVLSDYFRTQFVEIFRKELLGNLTVHAVQNVHWDGVTVRNMKVELNELPEYREHITTYSEDQPSAELEA